jgi:hypothetical protein
MKKIDMKRVALFWVAVLVCLAPGVTAHAKEGFFLGLQIPFNKINGDFDNQKAPAVKAGTGLGVIAGYGFSPAVSMELDLAGTGHRQAGDRIGFGEFSLNGKYAFEASPHVQPFLLFGLGSFTLGNDTLTRGGTGYNAGVGMDYYASSHLSLGAALIGKIIKYDRVVKGSKPALEPDKLNGETTSLRFDATYHF